MKCPLQKHLDTTKPGELTFSVSDCLQEECAWWDKVSGGCCIFLISRALYTIARDTVNIAKELTLIRPK